MKRSTFMYVMNGPYPCHVCGKNTLHLNPMAIPFDGVSQSDEICSNCLKAIKKAIIINKLFIMACQTFGALVLWGMFNFNSGFLIPVCILLIGAWAVTLIDD